VAAHLDVPALSDQLAAVAVTMGERLGSATASRCCHAWPAARTSRARTGSDETPNPPRSEGRDSGTSTTSASTTTTCSCSCCPGSSTPH